MKIIRLSIIVILGAVLFFLTASFTRASEGNIELASTTGQDMRCSVSSVLGRDLSYTLLVNCRDLTYPPAPDLFSYVLWSNPLKEGNPQKLGELGVGKAEFKTPNAFSNLFVTKERDATVKLPSELVVMQGQVQPVSFLEGPVTPAPQISPSPEKAKEATKGPGLLSQIGRAFAVLLLVIFFFIIIVVAAILTFRRLRD
ncbi:MAG: hypothetical protein Q8P89_04110 [bacterium]|nr:hypothetical protein [bacterium]